MTIRRHEVYRRKAHQANPFVDTCVSFAAMRAPDESREQEFGAHRHRSELQCLSRIFRRRAREPESVVRRSSLIVDSSLCSRRGANRRAENGALPRLHPPPASVAAGFPARNAQGRRPAQSPRRRNLRRRSASTSPPPTISASTAPPRACWAPPCDSCEQYTPKPAFAAPTTTTFSTTRSSTPGRCATGAPATNPATTTSSPPSTSSN